MNIPPLSIPRSYCPPIGRADCFAAIWNIELNISYKTRVTRVERPHLNLKQNRIANTILMKNWNMNVA